MPDKAFFDTNILLYALAQHDARTARAEQLLLEGGVVSVQVLNEFASVARRKLGMSWREVREALQSIRILCPSPRPLTIATHDLALRIVDRYSFEIYDALIVAAALEAKCRILFSEDMQDGQAIDKKLTIRNPFR
jgi:predicted nucleic acid-binding protein